VLTCQLLKGIVVGMMNRSNTKAKLVPIDHYASCNRRTRRTWAAELYEAENPENSVLCAHKMGHKTREAASDCARAMYAKLPA
jgi:hypothetical protein